jgi:phage terminase small subunit
MPAPKTSKGPAKGAKPAKKAAKVPAKGKTSAGTRDTKKTTPKAKERPAGLKNQLASGAAVDIDTIEWSEGCKLSDKEKRWVFWYTFPGDIGYKNGHNAALLAGYAKTAASCIGSRHKARPEIQKEVNRILKTLRETKLADEYDKIIDRKISRANFNMKDFYKRVERYDTETKKTYKVEVLKDIDELDPELQELIDGVDYRSQRGIRVYNLPNRDKSMDDIIRLYRESIGKADGDEYDVEAVADIVKDRLSLKMTVRRKNDELAAQAGILDAPAGLPEEE